MRQKIALGLAYAASILLILGGLGDQFIRRLLSVHLRYLGNPEPSLLLERSESLVLLMLHALGGALMASGVACFCMIHFALRRNQVWAKPAIVCTAILSLSLNAYGMYRADSYWQYPFIVLLLLVLGVLLYRIEHPSSQATVE